MRCDMEDVAITQPYYLDIADNLAFKRVFGQRAAMMGFLNEAFKGKYRFTDLCFADPLPHLAPWENPRELFMVRCIDTAGKRHYIEVVNADSGRYEWAATGYWFREYRAAVDDFGERPEGMKEKIKISIVVLVNFDNGKPNAKMRSDGIIGGNFGAAVGPDIAESVGDLVIYNATMAPSSLDECRDDLERLFCLSRMMAESSEEIDVTGIPDWIVKIMTRARYSSLMPDEVFRYMTSEDDHHYRMQELEDAREERRESFVMQGKEISVDCGVKKGRNEATEDIARKMRANEIEMKLISYCTGLSPATIKML